MAEANPRWTDAPEFQWNPDRPLPAEAQAPPPFEPNFEPSFEPGFKKTPANDDAAVTPKPAPKARAQSYLTSRLLIGAAQGIGLLSLANGQPALASPLFMMLLFAPLLLLAGLGRIPGKLLLPWTLLAALGLLALGAYQHWRMPEQPGMSLVVVAALFLFIGQAMIAAWARSGQPLAGYSDYFDCAWTLAIQSLLCMFAAGCAFVLAGSWLALLRQFDPFVHPAFLVTPIVTVSVAAMSWLAAPRRLRPARWALLTFLTLALPTLVLLSAAAGVAGLLLQWQPPLFLCLLLGFGLLLCLNASYRDGAPRPQWRQTMESAAAFALAVPVALGAFALAARVSQLGWTANRIVAAAALVMLAAYAFFYVASALIALGGGGWMKRIERANLALAMASLGLLLALASLVADPARLAVNAQVARLQSGAVAPDAFDFSWLASGGGIFGHRALEQMTADGASPEQARGALLALVTPPDSSRPAPTQIGANIQVRTPGARLPEALLATDWRQVKAAGVPPCLTTAALSCDAYFVDLDGDRRDEIVLVYGNAASWWGGVMKEDASGGWYPAGTLTAPACRGSFDALRAGQYATVPPLPGWNDLLVGGSRLGVALSGTKPPACAAP